MFLLFFMIREMIRPRQAGLRWCAERESFAVFFSATAEGNLDGVYYTYEVHTSDGTFSSHDPYARACGVNGHRSMVIDLSKTDPDGFADEDRPKSLQTP